MPRIAPFVAGQTPGPSPHRRRRVDHTAVTVEEDEDELVWRRRLVAAILNPAPAQIPRPYRRVYRVEEDEEVVGII